MYKVSERQAALIKHTQWRRITNHLHYASKEKNKIEIFTTYALKQRLCTQTEVAAVDDANVKVAFCTKKKSNQLPR